MAISAATIGGASMRTALSGFVNADVTILRATTAADAYGEMIPTWAPLAEHIDIPALVAGGDVSIRMKRQEFRTSQITHEMEYRRVLLWGHYPSIDHGDRARFQDREWAIVALASDVTATWTELLCESLEPGNI